ncbi:alpha/beta fold hydrolase [Mycolicibacterium sp. 624]|uniref:alpha/beta fold hydrolase n=1 Tax=Mycolicibacterium sp. 624 TaxID=3156314 RepID=UPI003393F480
MPPPETVACPRPALLLIHGAWHGPWCWEDLIPVLSTRGWRAQTVDLPSGLEFDSPAPLLVPGLYDDAAAITAKLVEIGEPTVVVAHSYGGAPATEACAHVDNVVHMIYLAAFQLDVGESVRTSMGAGPDQPIPDAGYSPPMHDADLYSDVDPEVATRATRRLRLQSDPSRAQTVRQAGWRTVGSSYVVCDLDAAVPPERQQRFAARADAIYHLPTGHSPFYSAPAELADLLGEIICKAAKRAEK